MRAALVDLLRCPFCSGAFTVHDRLASGGDRVDYGVLFCACCAYPVVDGIPVVRLSDSTSQAIREIEAGHFDAARLLAFDLDPAAAGRFTAWAAEFDAGRNASFEEAINALLPDGEGLYYTLRFSDPTFLLAQAVVRALASLPAGPAGPLLDVCGGCGHLSRVLQQPGPASRASQVVLCDASAWRLWVARRFVATRADVVCADANAPLPFRRGAFWMAVCNDALHYVWGKRLLADEMRRAVATDGIVVATHVHTAGGVNATPGQTLTPAAYRELFAPWPARVLADAPFLDRWLAEGQVCLGSGEAIEPGVDRADSVTVVASPRPEVFTSHAVARLPPGGPCGVWRLNPLYRVFVDGKIARLQIVMPTAEYDAEFGGARAYLPDAVEIPRELAESPPALAEARPDLVAQWVVVDLPPSYLISH